LLHCAPVKISVDDIRSVALLARLALTPAEEAELTTTLDQILQHMDQLNRLDTSTVEPTAHIVAVDTPWRDDVVTNTSDVDALLANAPARAGDLFLVPKIIE
jgi:aspartyl-tRNA(Asn)/glutamyl-tRNA(Gln) amidotransferase subunit C